MSDYHILTGDSLEVLKDFPNNSIDSVVTDPPYGLKFMGKKWDYEVPSVALWVEVLRVLKPGGHLLSFGGTRTYHRMVVNIEDAGFEIRDQIVWLYGSGFPKSLDVSKAIDKAAGAEREVIGESPNNRNRTAHEYNSVGNVGSNATITTPATDEAKEWQGWGTALKPANEPIVLARKPLEKGLTVAQNVLKWGVGGLNIDASRVEGAPRTTHAEGNFKGKQEEGSIAFGAGLKDGFQSEIVQGRWPANLILDEQAALMLDEQSGIRPGMFGKIDGNASHIRGDSGGASRFFYVAKASKRERGSDNNHPTVKPIKLMEYLVTLITPSGGTVLDPFTGSGTTGIAAINKGFDFIGIERESEYAEIAEKRLAKAKVG